MFTLKLYKGNRQRIVQADSFTVLRQESDADKAGPRLNWVEVTAHESNGEYDQRFDIGNGPVGASNCEWDYAFIENENGRTTEVIRPLPM